MTRSRKLILAVLGLTMASTVSAVGTANADDYYYRTRIECGDLHSKRMAAVATSGNYTAKFNLFSGYNFKWDNARSKLYFEACGDAAPYGNYPANAAEQVLRTEFRVSSVEVTGCDATGEVSFGKDKAGNSTETTFSASCSLGSKIQKQILVTRSQERAAQLVHGGDVKIQGTHCNYATLYVQGTIHAPGYNFNHAPLQESKRVTAC